MRYIEKRGLNLSSLTLGTVQLGMPYGIANLSGKPALLESDLLLKTAIDGGVTCYDTAGAYGDSEKVLGQFFSNRPKPVIITKLRLEYNNSTKQHDLEKQMRKEVTTSLDQLQISKIPVMMLHNPDVLLYHGESVKSCFQTLMSEQLISKAGVSFGADIHESFTHLLEYVEDDIYEAVQIPMNLLDHRLLHNNGLKRLHELGKLIFVRSLFLQGLLFMSPDALPDHLHEAREPLCTLRSLAEEEGLSLSQLAVTFIRDLPEIDSLVIGAETAMQFKDSLKLIAGPALSNQTRARIMESIPELPCSVLDPALWSKKSKWK